VTTPLYATGWSLHLPGADLTAAGAGEWARDGAAPADRAATVLGRKGLLAKDPATRLALCAVHRALGLPPGRRPPAAPLPGTAVVACSNLGNVETVARVARTVAEAGGRAVSVLDAPGVSSNVVSSAVALWFGFGGPNLMICSGARSGRAGLRTAALLLGSGRADRVVLVGVEPADEIARALHDGSPPLRAGAACVVLTAGPGPVAVHVRSPLPAAAPVPAGPVDRWGDAYGARDVVTLALAAHLVADEGHGVLAAGEPGDAPYAVVGGAP
jgi:3-oxoacyl-[acyl-carrier-protein] synthase II